MPNAAATLDTDFGFPTPSRRKPARPAGGKPGQPGRKKAGKTAGKMAGKTQMPRGVLDSMPRYGAIAISVLIGVGIVVNALMMQHGHHPAPLFGGLTPQKPVPAKAASAEPAARVEVPAAAQVAPAAPVAEAAPAPRPAAAKTAHGDDAIARLIGGGAPAATAHKVKAAGDRQAAGKTAPAKVAAGKAATDKHRKGED